MNAQDLWLRLTDESMVKGAMPAAAEVTEPTLWYVRVLQGFAGWLAAVFLLGFLGFGVAGLFEYGGALIVMGLLMNFSAYVFFSKNTQNDFFEQLVLVFSLTGQFLFAFGLYELFEFKSEQWLVLVAVYQVILMWVMNNYLHRFLSAWFAVIALFWGFEVLVYSGLGSALVAALFVWLWLHKTGWETERNFYEPIAYALAFALLQLNTQSQVWMFDLFYHQGHSSWLINNSAWLSALLNSTVLLYFIYRVAVERQLTLSSTSGRLVLLAAVVMLFSAMPVIGLSSALLVLLMGCARQNRFLMVMGGLALLGFVSWYYYSLNITLLYKSMVMIAVGVVLLLGFLLLKRYYVLSSSVPKTEVKQEKPQMFSLQKVAVALTLILGLGGVNHAIWQKELLLSEGQSVFLELAPVDPRSIMQGDYMRLRFALANDINTAKNQNEASPNHDGFVIVDKDARGVAVFNSLAVEDSELTENQTKMHYRVRRNRVQFATNAFFFQEGDAKLFDAARFGEFKVAGDGNMLLKAMYDKDLKLLGENRLD